MTGKSARDMESSENDIMRRAKKRCVWIAVAMLMAFVIMGYMKLNQS